MAEENDSSSNVSDDDSNISQPQRLDDLHPAKKPRKISSKSKTQIQKRNRTSRKDNKVSTLSTQAEEMRKTAGRSKSKRSSRSRKTTMKTSTVAKVNLEPVVFCSAETDDFFLGQDICLLCGSIGLADEGRMIACAQCGQCFHPYCIKLKITRLVLERGWRCYNCLICEICEERDDNTLLLCEDCELSFHTSCLSLDGIPSGAWRCQSCEPCVECIRCGSTSSDNTNWNETRTCSSCSCLICGFPLLDQAFVLQCKKCNRYFHTACYHLEEKGHVEEAAEKNIFCRSCTSHNAPSVDMDNSIILQTDRNRKKVLLTSEGLNFFATSFLESYAGLYSYKVSAEEQPSSSTKTNQKPLHDKSRKRKASSITLERTKRTKRKLVPSRKVSQSKPSCATPSTDERSEATEPTRSGQRSLEKEGSYSVDTGAVAADSETELEDFVTQTYPQVGGTTAGHQTYEKVMGSSVEEVSFFNKLSNRDYYDEHSDLTAQLRYKRRCLRPVRLSQINTTAVESEETGKPYEDIKPTTDERLEGREYARSSTDISFSETMRKQFHSTATHLYAGPICISLYFVCFEVRSDLLTNGKSVKEPWKKIKWSRFEYLASDASIYGVPSYLQDTFHLHDSTLKPASVKDNRSCTLCCKYGDGETREVGRLLNIKVDTWIHINCAFWSHEVFATEDGALKNVLHAVNRGKEITCVQCKEKGATVNCSYSPCNRIYHFKCAQSTCSFHKAMIEICGNNSQNKTVFCIKHGSIVLPDEPLQSLAIFRQVYVCRDKARQATTLFQTTLKQGSVLRIGALMLQNLGELSQSQKAGIKENDAIYPIDYQATRIFWSSDDVKKRRIYKCTVKKINDKPELKIGCTSSIQQKEHSPPQQESEESYNSIEFWHKKLNQLSNLRRKERKLKLVMKYINNGEVIYGLTSSHLHSMFSNPK